MKTLTLYVYLCSCPDATRCLSSSLSKFALHECSREAINAVDVRLFSRYEDYLDAIDDATGKSGLLLRQSRGPLLVAAASLSVYSEPEVVDTRLWMAFTRALRGWQALHIDELRCEGVAK